jgi:hypothetical protein
MKTITIINPENALRILNDCSLTTESDNISVVNGDKISLIFNSKKYNNQSFGTELRIGFDGGGIVGVRHSYITLCLQQFDDIIELELMELERGIALKINNAVVYYKIKYKTIDEIIKYPDIKALDLSGYPEFETLFSINYLENLESIKLTLGNENEDGLIEQNQFDFESFKLFEHLRCLNLRVNFSDNIKALSSLINLESFFIEFIDGWGNDDEFEHSPVDLSFIENMFNLKKLETYNLRRLADVSFLNKLKKLEDLNLCSPYALKKFNLHEPLLSLKKLDLSVPKNLENISFLNCVPNLEYLKLTSNYLIKSIEEISTLLQLKHLDFSYCSNIESFKNISYCKSLETINLEGSSLIKLDIEFDKLHKLKEIYLSGSKIFNLSNIYAAQSLCYLDVSGCDNLVQLTSIDKLSNLQEVRASYSPNVRNIEKLSFCKNLRILDIDDPVNAIQILMSCTTLRNDVVFIRENISRWIKNIDLSKDPVVFVSRLLSCINVIKEKNYQNIIQSCISMRSRGLQSEERNDLDAYTWSTWCNLALDLEKSDAISCMQAAVNELDIVRETEVILGPVIVAASKMIEKYPEEKENLFTWVNEKLQLLEDHAQEQRQIAPSAAVFFASLNNRDDVLFWLQRATDAKAPLWRERVLHALVKHYAHKNNITEARLLLDEMVIQDEKDHAIASLAKAMATTYPLDAGFLLNDIHDKGISSEAARTLLNQPSMLRQPQSVYQLLLHLQSNPDELAETLEKLIEKDPEGKLTEAVKQLFVQPQVTGPSATVLLELCKHPSIADFVKPRALEKYKEELQQRANIELNQSVPLLISEMQNAALLEEDEAQELTILMHTK